MVIVCDKCGSTERYKNGYNGYCKPCKLAREAKRRADYPEKEKARHTKYRTENSEKEKVRHAIYREENSQSIVASNARYYLDNTEQITERNQKRRISHPEEGRIQAHNRRARKRANGGRLSKGLAAKLFSLQRGKCACGCMQSLGDDYQLDHRMPVALGGSNTDDNMQLLTGICNRQKCAKHPIDFMQSRGFLL
ncbi:MAG: HNH endonuclease signature motif containing protein [Gallionella sp.]